ncbi:MAG: hypothetical protein JWO67_6290 [Streptosporangiaceae bacterium]|nr:hypothetical protein [Streptosporangiaceae bacterium]
MQPGCKTDSRICDERWATLRGTSAMPIRPASQRYNETLVLSLTSTAPDAEPLCLKLQQLTAPETELPAEAPYGNDIGASERLP